MGKLHWTGRTTTVGTLAITFKSGGTPQLIRYVRLWDVEMLQRTLRSNAEQEGRVVEIRRLIQSLRNSGKSDAQITQALNGTSPAEFERMATTRHDFPVSSYRVVEDPMFDMPGLVFVRNHTLKPHDFASVELRSPRTVMSPY